VPRVTIAVPVYNGATLLEPTLEDLAAQTERDLRIVIYNNASTDQTGEIAAKFVERDKRFRLVTRAATVPLFDNFLMTLDDFDCEYFGWRAYDDHSAPNYVEALTNLLVQAPQAALAGSQVRTYKAHKNRWISRDAPLTNAAGVGSTARLIVKSPASWIYGVFRRQHLDRWYRQAVTTLPHTWAADHATLFPMLVRDQCVTTNETYFVQNIGVDAAKKPMAKMSTDQQWAIFKAFYDYCLERLEETDRSASEKAMLKPAVLFYASKRTFRITRMARAKLLGR
jgi:Glycosyl transferase family 2